MTVIDLKTGKETTLPAGTRLSCALGNFDGVHMGHRELLLKAAKKEYGATASSVWTFRLHPQLYLGTHAVKIITSMEQKLEYFKEAGIEYAILEDFPQVSSLTPEEFAKNLLINKLGVVHAVCGFNFSFGKKAEGNCSVLKEYEGTYCIESFDPRCIVALRTNHRDVIRGQLTENFFLSQSKISKKLKFITNCNCIFFDLPL
jgi:FAD synthase